MNPFATKTNVVSDERMAWFATPVDKAVTEFLTQLANGYMVCFGTLSNEAVSRLGFQVVGLYLPWAFDWLMGVLDSLVEK